ncbi:MAG TPA: hypothetical protein DD477_02045 [Spirochaetaceae bacterium]|nr:hypothetical protein [Spirochaetaceae bacterium]
MAGLLAATGLAAGLAACQSAPPPPPPVPALVLSAGAITIAALDQFHVHLSSQLTLTNAGQGALELAGWDSHLALDSGWRQNQSGSLVGRLEPGQNRTLDWSHEFDLRDTAALAELQAGQDSAVWRATVSAWSSLTPDSPSVSCQLELTGSFPLLREPVLSIHSLQLLRHELINVLLALSVDIYNPNLFALVFSSTDYEFWGEGLSWNRSRRSPELILPPGETTRLRLPISLNFATMNRQLFDLVAKRQTVRYRLTGQATINTGLEFLPAFVLAFDRSGSIQVE